MRVIEGATAMREACRQARNPTPGGPARVRLGLVPTMGALHEGHLSLVRRARETCGAVAVSLFVNPLQFAANEDFSRYPRTLEQDLAMLERAGVDLVFVPSAAEMLPAGATTTVEVAGLSGRLDGEHRPGHFRGVATIVAKLFHIVQPDAAFFGQKDAVQVAVLRRMVRDLDFGVEMIACPTVRDEDGLALSSRNVYLSAAERAQAQALPRALEAMQAALEAGVRERGRVLAAGLEVLRREPGVQLEYLEAVEAESLEPVEVVVPGTLIAVAARVGRTRLIDNFLAQI